MLRATKMLPWNCGSSLSMREPVRDTGMVWPVRVRTTVSRVSCAACSRSKSGALALLEHREDVCARAVPPRA